MYSKNYNVRYSETGENFNLTLPALMSYFQDTSVEHSEFSNNGVIIDIDDNGDALDITRINITDF